MSNEQPDPDIQRIDKALADLSEHFDSVQIFTTRFEGNEHGTTGISRGVGNWYARMGIIKDWMIKEDENTRIKIRTAE